MRLLSCAAALFWLLVPSAAWAERITITAASATYWTATDTLEINVWYDKPLTVPGAFIAIGGESAGRWFLIENNQQTRGETFSVRQFFDGGQSLSRTFDMPFESASVEITIPFSDTGLVSPLFSMNTMARMGSDPRDIASNGFDIFSSIDERIVYTPEPSSVALASFGVVALLVHLARRPRLRHFRSERH